MLHRILSRLMEEQRLTRLDSENYSDNDLDLYTRNNEANFLPLKATLTREDFHKLMEKEQFSPIVLNKLIIDFFVKLGMKEEALTFAQELGSSISFKSELKIHQACSELGELFDSGRIEEAIKLVEEIVPGIFERRKDLLLQVLSLKLFNRGNDTDFLSLKNSLKSDLMHLASSGRNDEERQLLSSQLECIVGSFLFKKRAPFAADELIQNISREMFSAVGISQRTKIEELLSLLLASQESLSDVCEFSHFTEDGLFKITEEL